MISQNHDKVQGLTIRGFAKKYTGCGPPPTDNQWFIDTPLILLVPGGQETFRDVPERRPIMLQREFPMHTTV
jgi:hypothetical protein